jgi:hypothetical protein
MAVVVLVCGLVNIYLITFSAAVNGASPKWIDLSYPFVENETIYWPGSTLYTHTLRFYGNLPETGVCVLL